MTTNKQNEDNNITEVNVCVQAQARVLVSFFQGALNSLQENISELSMKQDSNAPAPRESVKERFLELFTLYIFGLKNAEVKDETLDNFLL